jgi:hypothetical protein
MAKHLTFGWFHDLRPLPLLEVAIPNNSPSRARADSDGPNPQKETIAHRPPKNVSVDIREWHEPKVRVSYMLRANWSTLGLPLGFTANGYCVFYPL